VCRQAKHHVLVGKASHAGERGVTRRWTRHHVLAGKALFMLVNSALVVEADIRHVQGLTLQAAKMGAGARLEVSVKEVARRETTKTGRWW
jgi:hypothetical protein